jgi:hypothetical protein
MNRSGTIRAAGLGEPGAVHHGLDRRRARHEAVRGEALDVVLPETPHRAVDAADGAGVVDVGDQQLKPADLLAAVGGAVGVAVVGQVVLHGALGVADPRFQQVDHPLLAGVLQHFQTGDADSDGGLSERVLRGGEDVRRA